MRETKIVVQAIQKYLKSHVLLYSNLKRVKRHRASYHTQMSEMKWKSKTPDSLFYHLISVWYT
jgi:hypothetical protein